MIISVILSHELTEAVRTPLVKIESGGVCNEVYRHTSKSQQHSGFDLSRRLVAFKSRHFYRAMHYSAKRGFAIARRPSVCAKRLQSVPNTIELYFLTDKLTSKPAQ